MQVWEEKIIQCRMNSIVKNYLHMILNRRQFGILQDKRNDKSQECFHKVLHTNDSFCALHIHRYHHKFDCLDSTWSQLRIHIYELDFQLKDLQKKKEWEKEITCMSPNNWHIDVGTILDIQHIHPHRHIFDHHWHRFWSLLCNDNDNFRYWIYEKERDRN